MSDETKTTNTDDQAAASATDAQEPNQSTPQPSAGKPAKAAPKKTTKAKAKASAKKTPPTPPVSKRPPEVETAKPTMPAVTAAEAIQITGAVVRPEGEPNGKAPEPVPAEPDDVFSMKVDGNRVTVITVDGMKFSGEIA